MTKKETSTTIIEIVRVKNEAVREFSKTVCVLMKTASCWSIASSWHTDRLCLFFGVRVCIRVCMCVFVRVYMCVYT